MKRKLLAVLMAAAMAATLLAGCNNSSDTSTPDASNAGASTSTPDASDAGEYADYPERAIEAIIAFDPGGGSDIAARSILNVTEKYLGEAFAIENTPGAGGIVGWTAIATGEPDGYTIGMINLPSVIFNPITMGDQVNYTMDDFAPIANFVSDPGTFAVLPDSEIQTLQDMIDAAKANPNGLRVAYSGPGTSEALTLRRLEQTYGIEIREVPFDGTGPMLTALLGGQVDVMCANVSEIVGQYTGGAVHLLAVGAEERIDMVPDVPTYIECGFDQTQVAMRGMAAPAGTPDEIIQILADAMEQAVNDPEFLEDAARQNLPLDFMGPEEYQAEIDRQQEFYQEQYDINPW